ncbi:MAG TPA: EAL domain-containing protein [Desulfotomaculum sp.]|nr:EAL domain-containing protein [Desulfotomaculum sp.]
MDLIREIIAGRRICTLFQPIHDLRKGEIMGYEALTRGPAGPLQSASNLFAAASSRGLRTELELACLREALASAGFVPPGKLLFLNFHPLTLAEHWEAILDGLGGLRRQAVIEITESSGQIRSCAKAQEQLRAAGVRIALDDVGAGDRALANMCEFRADFLKLDRSFIEGLMKLKNGAADRYRSMVRTLVDYAQRAGIEVIAEGVETEKQLLETVMAGIHLVQGFYFGKPRPAEYWAQNPAKERQAVYRG